MMPSGLPKCFVIMPFSRKKGDLKVEGVKTTVEIDFDSVYEEIIYPAIRKMNWEPVRADKLEGNRLTLNAMFSELLSAPYAIVDGSFLNANVYYELGARHAVRRGMTVAIAHRGTPIPYDIHTVPFKFEYDVGPDEKPVEPQKQSQRLADYLSECYRTNIETDSPIFAAAPKIGTSRRIEDCYTTEYAVLQSDGFVVGLKTGDLKDVKGVEAWVNSENDHMQMARTVERAVSATIRYLGAQHSKGRPTRDDIERQLRTKTENIIPIPLGQVIDTGPGALKISNGVHRIFHVATVKAEYMKGFTAGDDIGQYAYNAIKAVEDYNRSVMFKKKLSSVLLPIFGTGQARGEIEIAVDLLVAAAIRAVREIQSRNYRTRLRKIYFLAYDERARDALNRSLSNRQRSEDFPNGYLGASVTT